MSNAPPLRYFGEGDRVYVRAQQVWISLACIVMNSSVKGRGIKITYGDLAEAMDMDRKAGITLNRALGIVGNLCVLNDLPAINCIVVHAKTQEAGDHVVTRPGKSTVEERRDTMRVNWHNIRVPTTGTLRKVWEQMRKEG